MVATPIGNMRDITLRALDVLSSVDLIAAEDTRNTGHLLSHHNIRSKLIALHEHNERNVAAKLIRVLDAGQSVALVSDAGTPAVSDPGAILVAMVRDAGFKVTPLPGPNAAIAAISASGLSEPHFFFHGFLPHKSSARQRELEGLREFTYPIIFYEAPHRILECIADIQAVMGSGRSITFARELTKIFETIYSCDLDVALDWLKSDPNQQKGEFVLLLSGAQPREKDEMDEAAQRILTILMAELPLKQAVKLAADISGEKKNALYELALKLKVDIPPDEPD